MAADSAHILDINDVLERYSRHFYSYKEMSCLLQKNHGASLSTNAIRKRLKRIGALSRRGPTNHSEADIKRLIEVTLEDHPNSIGYRYMTDYMHREGIHVRRDTIMKLMREVDPSGVRARRRRRIDRKVYSSMGPNHVWHVDGYDKLKPYGFPIHGCIDGYSRRLIWLNVGATNNDPAVVAQHFLNSVAESGGCPLILQADPGTENSDMGALQCTLRHHAEDCFSGLSSFRVVKSTFNQRIEAWWSMLRRHKSEWWIRFFRDLEFCGLFDRGNTRNVYSLRYCFMPVLQKELALLLEQWNDHYVSNSRKASCPGGRQMILYALPALTGAVDCLHRLTEDDLQWFKLLERPISRSGCTNFDQYANNIFATKNWPDAFDWEEALYQYMNIDH